MRSPIVSEKLWSKIESQLPNYPVSGKGGRPRLELKKVFEGILYVKQNKIPWKNLPKEYGSKTAINDYFREWAKQGLFDSLSEFGITFLNGH